MNHYQIVKKIKDNNYECSFTFCDICQFFEEYCSDDNVKKLVDDYLYKIRKEKLERITNEE